MVFLENNTYSWLVPSRSLARQIKLRFQFWQTGLWKIAAILVHWRDHTLYSNMRLGVLVRFIYFVPRDFCLVFHPLTIIDHNFAKKEKKNLTDLVWLVKNISQHFLFHLYQLYRYSTALLFFDETRTESFVSSSFEPTTSSTTPTKFGTPSWSFTSHSGPLIALAPLNNPRASSLVHPYLVPTLTLPK